MKDVRPRRSNMAASLRRLTLPVVFAAACVHAATAAAMCRGKVAVEVLGSGGPIADDARASSGYLLWVDGEAKLLVDAGGGTFLRFGEAKAKFETLDAVAITHLHIDHVIDLPALLKSGFFSERTRPLPIIGPTGGGDFPGLKAFMRALFDPKRGAFRYLSGVLDGTGGLAKVEPIEILADAKAQKRAFANAAFSVTAVGVHHDGVPALGYLVEAGGRRIAFSGDQGGANPAFAAMIKGADILIMDHAVPEDTGEVEANLHDRPSEIGALAAGAGVKRLILSHNMGRSLSTLADDLAQVGKTYHGPVAVAHDLMCVE